MASLNKVFLMGNLTRDPELRYLQSGTAILKAGLAVNRKYRNRDQEWVEETTFVDIEGWGNQAENFSRYLTKGRPVFIEGRLKLDSWESKEGQKRTKLLVVMDNFQFIGAREGGQSAPRGEAPSRSRPPVQAGQPGPSGSSGPSAGPGDQKQAEDYDFDDIPF